MGCRLFLSFILLLTIFNGDVYAQYCIPDVYAREFTGDVAAYHYASARNNAGELIVAGSSLQPEGQWQDAMLTKYSSRGNVLWAKRYSISGYNAGSLHAVAATPDSGIIVTGFFSMLRKRESDGQIEVLYSAAMIWKLDKFGNLVKGKLMTAFATYSTYLNSMLPLKEGGYLVAGSVMGRDYNRNIFFYLDENLDVHWTREFYDDYRKFPSYRLVQRRNGEVLVAGSSYLQSEDRSRFEQTGYFLFNIRPSTGTLIWSRAYSFNPSPVASPVSLQPVQLVTEHANGDISLLSSYSDSTVFVRLPNVRSALHIKLNEFGVIQDVVALTHEQPGCRLIDALHDAATDRFILFTDDGEYSRLSAYNPATGPAWSRAISKVNGNLMGAALYMHQTGYQLFFSGRTQVAQSGIIKTEANGEIPCMETPSLLQIRNAKANFREENISPRYQPAETNLFDDLLTGLNKPDYPWTGVTTCETNCCVNIPSDTSHIELCNQSEYRLPDNQFIRESGLYYTTHKTRFGCDSTAYYRVAFSFDPLVQLGADTCFNNADSITIHGPQGYSEYRWNNTPSAASSIRVTSPGSYSLEIRNKCGTGKDSIIVFRDCAFDIHMPNAFSPNSDGLNDVFRVPGQNKNKLLRLAVYNRLGQLVFETADKQNGWNGYWKNKLQPSGTYIYKLQMKTLDGRTVSSQGTLTLIR